jgi:hypothetical protein
LGFTTRAKDTVGAANARTSQLTSQTDAALEP